MLLGGLVGPSLYEPAYDALNLLGHFVRRVGDDSSDVVELAQTMDFDNLGFFLV